MNPEGAFTKLKPICAEIATEPTAEKLKELQAVLTHLPSSTLQRFQEYVLFPLILHLKTNKIQKEDTKKIAIDTITQILNATRVERAKIFFEVYWVLLQEIYLPNAPHLVANIHEEYKQSIVDCVSALFKTVSWDLLSEIYVRENASKFSPFIYVCLSLAKNEQLKSLRIAAMKCIQTAARIQDEADTSDNVIRFQVADIFMFFLPGIAVAMRQIAQEDDKVGHKIISTALSTFGRIVTLLMQDYNATDNKIDFGKFNLQEQVAETVKEKNKKWKTKEEMNEYIETSKRTENWYKTSDLQLKQIIQQITKLHSNTHPNVRNELADMCILILDNCIGTMPESTGKLVETLLVLSEDDYENISIKSKTALKNLTHQFSTDGYKTLLENLQEHFFITISTLPSIMNSSEEETKLSSLNLLIGYLKLFGEQHLINILHSPIHLKRFILSLIQISELERTPVSILEEYTPKALEMDTGTSTPWIQFRYFNNNTAGLKKIQKICSLLIAADIIDIVSDYLLDIFVNDVDKRKEATLILNELLSVKSNGNNVHIIKNVINTYTESENWNLSIAVTNDSDETLADVRNNVIQICLLVEGIGKIALAIGDKFHQFMLKCLYLVLERAGSGLPLVQTAGLGAIANISVACNYANVTELVSKNTDYFSYHVIRKLRRINENEPVLDVLAVVMNYSTIDVLPFISDIINGVLMQSFETFQSRNINSFLRIFLIFIKCLHRWLNVTIEATLPSKKPEDNADFTINDINYDDDFSDDIMEGKSAEELYKEDMARKAAEEDQSANVDAYEDKAEKTVLPIHVQLTVSILKRTLNFLPSKDKNRKLLVIEILKDGLEVIREWEDELLPLVHQTWSPLVDRFKEFDEPLVINLSFQLLVTLARLSKYFIRSRTEKEIIPSITKILKKLSIDSKLKDKGSLYRYTQTYKLQLELLNNLPKIIVYLEMNNDSVKSILESVAVYLSDKQPLPLQETSAQILLTLPKYDYKNVVAKILIDLTEKEYLKNRQIIELKIN